jgi:polyhydroxyalkanoate synthase
MADKLIQPGWDPLLLAAQLQKIATQSQTLMQRFVSSQPDAIKLGIGDTSSLGFDFFELMTKMMSNPAAVASAQIDLFYGTLNVWQKTAERMFMLRAQEANAPKDRRFKSMLCRPPISWQQIRRSSPQPCILADRTCYVAWKIFSPI